jgi:hypothetical protein
MAMASRPSRNRPVTGVPEAARILGRDVRTVRRMIEAGELEGGAARGHQRRQWFVYSDQLPPFAGPAPPARLDPGQGDVARMRSCTLGRWRPRRVSGSC